MVAPPKADAVKSAKPTAPRLPESGADVWILWRRVSGGLNTSLQQALYDRLRPVLLPAKGKAGPKPSPNELAEMWRAAASLERLEVKHKEAMGTALLKLLRKSPVPTYAFWALTRLGARSLIYGPLNAVVHPQTVEKWVEAILPFEPGNQSERMAWGFCLSQLARRTGQRAPRSRRRLPAARAECIADVGDTETLDTNGRRSAGTGAGRTRAHARRFAADWFTVASTAGIEFREPAARSKGERALPARPCFARRARGLCRLRRICVLLQAAQ